ncbi:DUF3253 domain-containing protein [Cyclobacterium sp.]|uniref:DUF3253 domain-containing protein n=1 Tax=Cyclobacterium sp. TaxID=1966343 RepID=UPI0019A1E430|nr:DUF3253 domain-containing protein [Cyclobacterium sp.]MBD3628886.1 DUF3253 domain-containing protein [Cyclobacterium sp.]
MDYLKQGILVLATMEMAKRRRGSSFCPSDVVRWLYPNDWRHFMEEEMEAAMWLFDQDLLEIRQDGNLIDQNYLTEAPVRLNIK